MKTLKLTLHKKAFEVMVTGEKCVEYRKPSKWIMSRLKSKNYDEIEFVNGYGAGRPRFRVQYHGYKVQTKEVVYGYSNGLVVETVPGDIVILLGNIVK